MKPTKQKPNTCLASARISTAKQITGESLDEQVAAIKKYTLQMGLTILPKGEVAIEVYSGAKRRPVYEEHLKFIKENPGMVGYYVIRYIDRFTRGGVGEYNLMKQELADLGVSLVDTYGIIQPTTNMPEMADLGFSYSWSEESPSEMTETMMAIQGEQERKTILKRTIPKQIRYTQRGYHIGAYDDGYKGKRVHEGDQIRYIQVEDKERSPFIKKIYELRAESKLSDNEIVEYLNETMGYTSPLKNKWNKEKTSIIGRRGGKKLSVKQMHRILKRFTYAGIICEKWTHNRPVKAKYDGLVSIDLFNRANRGKTYIKESPEGLEVIYDYKIESRVYKRLRNNPNFPFKCIKCPICSKPLKGSSSTGKSGKRFPSYHCTRGHKRFSVKKEEMEKVIEHNLSKLSYSSQYIQVLGEVLIKKFESRINQINKDKRNVSSSILLLKEEQEQALNKYLLADSKVVQTMLDQRIVEIEGEIKNLESKQKTSSLKKEDIHELLEYAKKIVEHPQKTLLDKENPLRQQKLLGLVFDGFPTYEELASGTPKLSFIFMAENGKSTSKTSTSSQLGCYW